MKKRNILCAAAVAATATLAVNAANIYWTGVVNNYADESGNWDANRFPNNDDAFFTDSGAYTDNEVVFTNACANAFRTYINGVGTSDAPLVFRSTSAANGLQFGNSRNTYIANTSAAYLQLKSGTWSSGNGQFEIGASEAGQVTLTDGAKLSVGGHLLLKHGRLILNNATVTIANDKNLQLGASSNDSVIELNAGGTLVTKRVHMYTNGGTVLFNGGTLKANAVDSNGLVSDHNNITVHVGEGGGTIDANNLAIAFPRLIAPSGANDGGMTFKGGGSVTFKYANTYTGVTTVEVGTTLVVPSAIAGSRLAFTIPGGLANGVYTVVSISGNSQFEDDVLSGKAEGFVLSGDKKKICYVKGMDTTKPIYIGGNGGSLSIAGNWLSGSVPTSGNITFDFPTAATVMVGDTFRADTITIPNSSAVMTIGAGNLHISGSLTNANKLAIASGASLTVDGDIVVCDGKGTFLNSNEGTVTVAGNAVCKSSTTAKQYDVLTASTNPMRVGGLMLDRTGGRAYFRIESNTAGPGAWVVGANGLRFLNPASEGQTRFYAQNRPVTLYSSADWTLANTELNNTSNGDLEVYGNSSLTIDTTDYTDKTTAHTVTLEGRVKAEGNVTIAGCGTVVVATTVHPGGSAISDTQVASGKTLAVTDTATLKVNAGKSIKGAGTISLAAGTTLALESTASTFMEADIIPVTLPTTGTATIKIDGTRIRGGRDFPICTLSDLPEGYNVADHVTVTGTALDGRKYDVKTVEVTENETTVTKLVFSIASAGMMLFVR